VAARCFFGEVLWLKGYADGARRSAALALKEAKSIGHTHSIAMSLFFCGLVSFLCRDGAAVREYLEEMMVLGSRHSIGAWPILGRSMQGWSQAAQGNLDEGLVMMNQGMDSAEKVGVSMFMPFLKCRMAEILLSLGRIAESERTIADTEAIMNRTGERNYEGEMRRLKGELFWRNGQMDEAKSQFCDALAIARRQGAKLIELRATTSYARFIASLGCPHRAFEMVSSVAAWFDESKDCYDLVAAKAVLLELRNEMPQMANSLQLAPQS
jgi:predicted ATPase